MVSREARIQTRSFRPQTVCVPFLLHHTGTGNFQRNGEDRSARLQGTRCAVSSQQQGANPKGRDQGFLIPLFRHVPSSLPHPRP